MFQVYIYTWTLEPLEDDFPLQPDVVLRFYVDLGTRVY